MATRALCRKALDQHEAKLSSAENVVGLGIVPQSDDDDRNLAVAVYVLNKRPETVQSIPKTLSVESKTVPVRIIEQGAVQKESLS